MTGIVIIGAGHGGGSLAANLRQFGHEGPILLLGDEPVAPYHRPPLSKAYLKGTAARESLLFRPDSFYTDQKIDLALGARAEFVDAAAHEVVLSDGRRLAYDKLVLATGSRARRVDVPGADLSGIYYLRDMADADRIRSELGAGRRLVIIGGGYIGLEAAASAIALGSEAVIVEREDRILARVACAELSAFFDGYHRAKGVEILTGRVVSALEGESGHVRAVLLADGSRIACDAVLVGIGAIACDELAVSAGLVCEGGVVVDEEARTSDPDIYAIGDMTSRPLPLYGGRRFRLESVPNAVEQARRVAADITGRPQGPHEVPWFWSDQYELKLQIAGVPFDSRHLAVRGSVEDRKFAIFHLSDDNRVLAVEAVGMPAEFMAGRALVACRKAVPPDQITDLTISIKEIAGS
ncbi:MAG: NAD(P)/FAD-dependent oxidoreductase [Allosphingosinicella sp.]|uniref:NAD(P)/FAD-dependent oxidoreductase n=1 Tax=Allosphingosinicella sp. TaxID=2823234 RepID=UPI00395ADCE6